MEQRLGKSILERTSGLRSDQDDLSEAQHAYLKIRELIVTGSLRPGQVIRELDLVQHLNIGRTPVREAVQRLATQHFVSIFPRRGLAVAKLSLEDVQAIFEARETVEARTAELAALRRTDEEAKALMDLSQDADTLAHDEVYTAFLDTDEKVHLLIAAMARNYLLAESVDHLMMLSSWIWHQHFITYGSSASAYFMHHKVAQAICEQDSAVAKQHILDHIRQSREVVVHAALRTFE